MTNAQTAAADRKFARFKETFRKELTEAGIVGGEDRVGGPMIRADERRVRSGSERASSSWWSAYN